ncbi:hypothetical protein COCMIDRAFT_82847 [Bipolaris oryzae ATCC 44560]|uniref:Uncharacterized protein n=1 Tax=Bipolaris oryzae ATCC 44560 TaxID=930090 RepID=W6ZRH0_COCMI|nr:uncharacterized protein COCMIDRAFT_82847 [Bipolaris oryzae ATCC 44560]EUC50104.1 hypothetical protein COCMIDRAFT_82847 [Bipolaris oryzae ATCC 44560]
MPSHYGASTRQGGRLRNTSELFERYRVVRLMSIVWGKSAPQELILRCGKDPWMTY